MVKRGKNTTQPTKTAEVKPENKNQEAAQNKGFVLEKENYILIAAGFFLIVIGFFLMAGGGAEDPAVFSDEIFSFRRITLAPIIILIGFVIEIFAIMWIPPRYRNNN